MQLRWNKIVGISEAGNFGDSAFNFSCVGTRKGAAIGTLQGFHWVSDFYPGPAVKNVPLSMAPQKSQDIIAEFGRPEYAKLIAENPIELSLTPDKLVLAFRRWDEEVGSKKAK